MTMVESAGRYCSACGESIKAAAEICPHCGVRQLSAPTSNESSEKSFVAMLILCFVLGGLGVHRFYAGKTGTGILMFLTLGALGIWTFIDFIVIVTSNFSDKNGNKIRP
jgi:TM2 domain-containing membrane protein YozV